MQNKNSCTIPPPRRSLQPNTHLPYTNAGIGVAFQSVKRKQPKKPNREDTKFRRHCRDRFSRGLRRMGSTPAPSRLVLRFFLLRELTFVSISAKPTVTMRRATGVEGGFGCLRPSPTNIRKILNRHENGVLYSWYQSGLPVCVFLRLHLHGDRFGTIRYGPFLRRGVGECVFGPALRLSGHLYRFESAATQSPSMPTVMPTKPLAFSLKKLRRKVKKLDKFVKAAALAAMQNEMTTKDLGVPSAILFPPRTEYGSSPPSGRHRRRRSHAPSARHFRCR